jgi:hypothetical protein
VPTSQQADKRSTGIRRMSPGQRFRARRKLTAALARVIEVVVRMTADGVAANRENMNAAITALKVFERFLSCGPRASRDGPAMVPVSGKRSIERVIVRRVRESRKRRRRRGSRPGC